MQGQEVESDDMTDGYAAGRVERKVGVTGLPLDLLAG